MVAVQRDPQRLELRKLLDADLGDVGAAHPVSVSGPVPATRASRTCTTDRTGTFPGSGARRFALARLERLAGALQHVDRLVHERRDLLEQDRGLIGVELPRLQAGAERLEVGRQLLQARLVYLPTPCSRATRPRMPFTSAPASGEA
jgi:hypothetical protein